MTYLIQFILFLWPTYRTRQWYAAARWEGFFWAKNAVEVEGQSVEYIEAYIYGAWNDWGPFDSGADAYLASLDPPTNGS